MPHMKYFQSLSIMKEFYEEDWKIEMLQDIFPEATKEEFFEEYEAVIFLMGYRTHLIFNYPKSLSKPKKEVFIRTFTRKLKLLDEVHHINKNNIKVLSKEFIKRNIVAYKQFLCCNCYLIKFEKDAYYNHMPEKISSFNEKYRR
jgi:hypothetical protein